MRRSILGGLLILATVLVMSLIAVADVRGPISILGNGDFTVENGVVGGTGTEADPFMIVGWEIRAGSDDTYAVRIENTSAPFVLRGLVIQGAGGSAGSAIRVGFASHGRIENCSISNSLHGIELISSTDVTLRDNVLYVSGRGLRVTGDSVEEYRHDIDESNLLNDYGIRYLVGRSGETISEQRLTHLSLVDCSNMTVQRNEVVNGDGIQLFFVTDSTVVGNAALRTSAVYTEHGIFLYRSSGNTLDNNLLQNNRLAGIQLSLAHRNEVVGNYFWANDTGIRLVGSDENRIAENDLLANPGAILLDGGSSGNHVFGNMIRSREYTAQGITLELATANTVEMNGLTGCEIGVMIGPGASNNELRANTIVSGAYGISLSGTYNRIIGNMVTQHSRAILFPETYRASVTRGNDFADNVFADNGHHIYTNKDSYGNSFSGNLLFGNALGMVSDNGSENLWSVDGVGNYWGTEPVSDDDGDGFADHPLTVYPSAVVDESPLASFDARPVKPGMLSQLEQRTIRLAKQDGASHEISALWAEKLYERWVGYRGLPEDLLEVVPAILFVFDEEIEGNFTMMTVPFDLDIAFFDSDGILVGSTTMTAMAEDLYTASSPFQYALELPSGSIEALAIDAETRLEIP